MKRDFQLAAGGRWLKLLLQHVPDKNEHLVRYYGHYSNRARGDLAKREATAEESCAPQSGWGLVGGIIRDPHSLGDQGGVGAF